MLNEHKNPSRSEDAPDFRRQRRPVLRFDMVVNANGGSELERLVWERYGEWVFLKPHRQIAAALDHGGRWIATGYLREGIPAQTQQFALPGADVQPPPVPGYDTAPAQEVPQQSPLAGMEKVCAGSEGVSDGVTQQFAIILCVPVEFRVPFE